MVEEGQIRQLIGRMTAERDKLLRLLESLSEEEAILPGRPGEWNIKQQMSHLCEVETAYRAWLQLALEEDGINVDGVWGERPAIPLEEADQHSVGEHISEMRRQRQKTVSLIASMRPEDFDRKVTSSLFGSLTAMRLLRCYYRHDRTHYGRVRRQERSHISRIRSGDEAHQPGPSATG